MLADLFHCLSFYLILKKMEKWGAEVEDVWKMQRENDSRSHLLSIQTQQSCNFVSSGLFTRWNLQLSLHVACERLYLVS